MFHTPAGQQSSRRVRGVFSGLCAAAVLLGLPGVSHARDDISEARDNIRDIKEDIAEANKDISSLEGRILAGDLLIAGTEAAIREAKKKPDNDGAVLALEITLAALKSKKDDLIKEKEDRQDDLRQSKKELAEWEDLLRKLGG